MLSKVHGSPGIELLLGKYKHFKGNEYQLLGIARHSEIDEKVVVYRQLYGERDLWVRPLKMFMESVEICGETVQRFTYIGPMDEDSPLGLAHDDLNG